jgi:predicted  nucleic acid-binding Zn-ribbon protein
MEETDPTILQEEIDALRVEVEAMTAQRKRAREAQTDRMSRLMYAREIAALKKALQQAVDRIEELEKRVNTQQ